MVRSSWFSSGSLPGARAEGPRDLDPRPFEHQLLAQLASLALLMRQAQKCHFMNIWEDGVDFHQIRYEKRDHVVTITLDRPAVHNCINSAMSAELQTAWKTFRDDDDGFVAIITGAGDRAFSTGWDLKEAAAMTSLGTFDRFRVSVYNSEGYCGYTRRVDIFKPVIAAVNGFCFAAGLETALLADIRIAAERAEFGCLERRWNIVAGDGLTARLPLVVGFARAMELLITGRRFGAEEALRIGLVTEVVPNDQVAQRAEELARSIAELPQGAIRSDKECVVRGVGRTLEERLRFEAEMALSMFLRRDRHTLGAGSFIEGVRPEWQAHGL
jgi:enoyl-CoA hydratase/carnithine racemase